MPQVPRLTTPQVQERPISGGQLNLNIPRQDAVAQAALGAVGKIGEAFMKNEEANNKSKAMALGDEFKRFQKQTLSDMVSRKAGSPPDAAQFEQVTQKEKQRIMSQEKNASVRAYFNAQTGQSDERYFSKAIDAQMRNDKQSRQFTSLGKVETILNDDTLNLEKKLDALKGAGSNLLEVGVGPATTKNIIKSKQKEAIAKKVASLVDSSENLIQFRKQRDIAEALIKKYIDNGTIKQSDARGMRNLLKEKDKIAIDNNKSSSFKTHLNSQFYDETGMNFNKLDEKQQHEFLEMNEVSVRKQGRAVLTYHKPNRLNDHQKLILASESTQWYLKNSFDTGWKGTWFGAGVDTYNNMNKKDKEKVKNVIPAIGNLIYNELKKKGGTPTIDEFMGSYNKFIGEYNSTSYNTIQQVFNSHSDFEKFGVVRNEDNIFLMKYLYYLNKNDRDGLYKFLESLEIDVEPE